MINKWLFLLDCYKMKLPVLQAHKILVFKSAQTCTFVNPEIYTQRK